MCQVIHLFNDSNEKPDINVNPEPFSDALRSSAASAPKMVFEDIDDAFHDLFEAQLLVILAFTDTQEAPRVSVGATKLHPSHHVRNQKE